MVQEALSLHHSNRNQALLIAQTSAVINILQGLTSSSMQHIASFDGMLAPLAVVERI